MRNTDEDKPIRDPAEQGQSHTGMSPFGHLFRFIGWWFGFAGLYAAFAVCPFCGRQGCPVGLASAGTAGAFFALCIQDWRRLFALIKHTVTRRKERKSFSQGH